MMNCEKNKSSRYINQGLHLFLYLVYVPVGRSISIRMPFLIKLKLYLFDLLELEGLSLTVQKALPTIVLPMSTEHLNSIFSSFSS